MKPAAVIVVGILGALISLLGYHIAHSDAIAPTLTINVWWAVEAVSTVLLASVLWVYFFLKDG